MSQLIQPEELAERQDQDNVLVVDTRFLLDDPDYGERAWSEGHIPGAAYLHLDRDLSSPVVPGKTGRHPLPDSAFLEARLREIGLRQGDLVMVYDDGPGFFAARLWWLLRWLGHDRVRVLDGGMAAWDAAGFSTVTKLPARPWPGDFLAWPDNSRTVAADVLARDISRPAGEQEYRLLDARGPERFRGEQEPIDPVAGHIPGARNLPCAGNIDDQGRFLSANRLRERLNKVAPDNLTLVSYCGSGVTACHNILAAVEAGLPEPLLYPGSWSEWVTDPQRPVATGDD